MELLVCGYIAPNSTQSIIKTLKVTLLLKYSDTVTNVFASHFLNVIQIYQNIIHKITNIKVYHSYLSADESNSA